MGQMGSPRQPKWVISICRQGHVDLMFKILVEDMYNWKEIVPSVLMLKPAAFRSSIRIKDEIYHCRLACGEGLGQC